MGKTALKPAHFRMTIAEFRRAAFLGKAPCANTIKATIERGDWTGERVGGLYYIFVDELGQPIPGSKKPPATGNEEADRIIMEWEQRK